MARGPGMGSMAHFTPPPCGRATRVVTKVGGPLNAFTQARARGLLTHRGSGRTLERIGNRRLWSSMCSINLPRLTRAYRIAQLNHGPLHQHGNCRDWLKGTPRPAAKDAGQSSQSSNHAGRRFLPLDECKHSSKASGATPAGALTRPCSENGLSCHISI